MDLCRNVPVSGKHHQLETPPCSIDDLFTAQNTEVDVSLEWLSIFVEDCFSSTGNYFPVETKPTESAAATATGDNIIAPPNPKTKTSEEQVVKQPEPELPQKTTPLQNFVVPGKARTKRKRATKSHTNPLSNWSHQLNPTSILAPSNDPPLLQQTYWLADSELILPKKPKPEESLSTQKTEEFEKEDEKGLIFMGNEDSKKMSVEPRRCSHCLSQRTPQWRAGPLGPKTLCNACGVRYKSGRLLPEYRPAKSPTFVSFMHSNSHKKVLEMRMSSISD